MEIAHLDYAMLDSINLLSPYGQAWEEPLFSTIFKVKKVFKNSRPKLDDMYIFTLVDSKGTSFETVYFGEVDNDLVFRDGMELNVIYSLEYNATRGKGLSIQIKGMSEY